MDAGRNTVVVSMQVFTIRFRKDREVPCGKVVRFFMDMNSRFPWFQLRLPRLKTIGLLNHFTLRSRYQFGLLNTRIGWLALARYLLCLLAPRVSD